MEEEKLEMEIKWLVDTNVLLSNLAELEDYHIVITSHVYRELENHKSYHGDEQGRKERSFRAREAVRYLRDKDNQHKITRDMKDYKWTLSANQDSAYVDNLLIQACVENGYGIITNDGLVQEKAEMYNIPLISLSDETKGKVISYTGIMEVEVHSDKELAEIYEYDGNKFDLLTNQYLVIKYGKDIHCHRWNGEELVDIELPPKRIVEPKNYHQACALDMLWNKDIPIKIIAGTYGSGKTFLASKVGMGFLKSSNSKKHYGKLMMVRNPIGSGQEIGFLKGTKEDKTADFFKPIEQHLDGGEAEIKMLEAVGQLSREIPYFMKGLSIPDTFILVDEAEDLNKKLIKLLGTRLAHGSCIVFSGDFEQAEDKYIHNNGLYIAIDKLKGNPLVGIVVLDEDVRSNASKVFSKL